MQLSTWQNSRLELVDLCQFLGYNIGTIKEEKNMQLSDKIRIIRKARGYSQEGLGMNLSHGK